LLISIGVDPGGSNSALAIIDSKLNILELTKAPFYVTHSKGKINQKLKINKEKGTYEKDYRKYCWTDYTKLGDIYRKYINNDIVYTIEKVRPRRGEGENNSFIFGNSLGVHQGQYSLLNPIKYYEILPQEWKGELNVTSDKKTSIDLANNIFNKQLKKKLGRLLKYTKTANKDDDLAEALLLAFFGLDRYYKED
jgi:hypothetical protein